MEKLSPKESVEGAHTVPKESPESPATQCRHPRNSPKGTDFPHYPKDFQQLLRISKSWGSFSSRMAFYASALALSVSGLDFPPSGLA